MAKKTHRIPPAPHDNPQRIAILTLDHLAPKMAGPAIRCWEMAKVLCQEHQVMLLTFGKCELPGEGFTTKQVHILDFRKMLDDIDIIIMQGFLLQSMPFLHLTSHYLVADWYDPFHLESLEVEKYQPIETRNMALYNGLRELENEASRADLFLCASPKQRDFWLGYLAGMGRINPLTYDIDPNLDRLLVEAPYGISIDPPKRTPGAIKGVIPGISHDDKVVIWGGGVYNWFDPLTCIKAVDLAKDTLPNLRLFFMGMAHPNPDVPETKMAGEARALAKTLGLEGKHVFFNEDWVEYPQRSRYLCDADIGISAHFQHIETQFSFRTRILDYLWTGLPILCTEGDSFAKLVEEENLGQAVPCQDVQSMADALVRLLTDDTWRAECSRNVQRVSQRYLWPRALEKLVEYCRNPYKSADWEILQAPGAGGRLNPVEWVKVMAHAVHEEWLYGGFKGTLRKTLRYIEKHVFRLK